MSTRVLLTGGMSLESGDVAITGDALRGRRARILLALLVSERHRPVPSDELAEALWPRELPASWEPSLRAVASEVRAYLAAAGFSGSRVLTSAFGCYQLHLPDDTVVDVELAAASVAAAQAALDAGDARAACEHAQLARSVAARPLLPGVEGAWVERKRVELRGVVSRSLEVLGEGHRRAGEPRLAVAAAEEALRVEPYSEFAHRCLMVAHAAAGNRAEALRAYERCRQLLADELGVDPSPATRAVHHALLREQPADRVAGGVELRGRSSRFPAQVAAHGLPPALEPAGSPAFVGRRAELDRLSVRWGETLAGHGCLVLIGGEPGIGKTRLAGELAARASADGAVVLFGHCDEGLGIPYQPFIEALGHYVTVAPDAVLDSVAEIHAAEVAMLLPGLARRLPELPVATEPAAQRYLLFQGVATLIDAAARTAPLLLVLDDLQWADRGTLLMLGHLARTVGSSGLLAVATFRDTDLDRAVDLADLLAELRRERGVERIALRGLGDADVGRLMAAVIGSELAPTDMTARAIHADTEGNPFYVCELARHFAETAAGAGGGDPVWTVPAGRLRVPDGVREVVRRRLTHLSAQAAHALTAAAVVGRDFDVTLLAAVTGLDEATLLDVVDETLGARLISELPGQVDTYRFAHDIVRQTLDTGLSGSRRARLHLRIADALESLHAGDLEPVVPEVAHHLLESRIRQDDPRVAEYARRAGDVALSTLAFEEASRLYERAMVALPPRGSTAADRCELLLRIGEVRARSGDVGGAQEAFLGAAAIARDERLPELLAGAAMGYAGEERMAPDVSGTGAALLEEALAGVGEADSEIQVRLLSCVAQYNAWSNDDGRLRTSSTAALEMARRLGDSAALGQALGARLHALAGPDGVDGRLRVAAELRPVAASLGDPRLALAALEHEITAHLERGDRIAADRGLDAYAVEAQRSQVLFAQNLALHHRIFRAVTAGDLGAAERALDATQAPGRCALAPGVADAIVTVQRYLLRWLQGRMSEMESELAAVAQRFPAIDSPALGLMLFWTETGRRELARSAFAGYLDAGGMARVPANAFWAMNTFLLVTLCADLGDAERAAVLYRALRRREDAHLVVNAWAYGGSCAHHLGRLAAVCERWDDAEAHFTDALARHRAFGSPPFVAVTQDALGHMLRRRRGRGDARRAEMLLRSARETAASLGMRRLG